MGSLSTRGHSWGPFQIRILEQRAEDVVCVLLDLTMPRLDGVETHRMLRKLSADVPVILCSGYAEEDLKKRFAGRGATDFLHKPFRVGALVEKLRAVLET